MQFLNKKNYIYAIPGEPKRIPEDALAFLVKKRKKKKDEVTHGHLCGKKQKDKNYLRGSSGSKAKGSTNPSHIPCKIKRVLLIP
jgi:hypothetical protein